MDLEAPVLDHGPRLTSNAHSHPVESLRRVTERGRPPGGGPGRWGRGALFSKKAAKFQSRVVNAPLNFRVSRGTDAGAPPLLRASAERPPGPGVLSSAFDQRSRLERGVMSVVAPGPGLQRKGLATCMGVCCPHHRPRLTLSRRRRPSSRARSGRPPPRRESECGPWRRRRDRGRSSASSAPPASSSG